MQILSFYSVFILIVYFDIQSKVFYFKFTT